MNLKELAALNPHIVLQDVRGEHFNEYGRIISGYDFSELVDYVSAETDVPGKGNVYRASVPELERFPVMQRLENEFYGEMPVQIGYCNGRNSALNGLEYHRGSEINVAVTDMVLFLGRLQDVHDDRYDSGKAGAFFVEKGTSLQLYETSLHFSPCRTGPGGFKCIVILPRGTNEPLREANGSGGRLLFARNKWLLAHPERKPLMEQGAWPGIIGENTELRIR
jgi:hypothetical protein